MTAATLNQIWERKARRRKENIRAASYDVDDKRADVFRRPGDGTVNDGLRWRDCMWQATRVREALIGGFISAATGLQRWRTAREAEGKAGLAATSAITIGGESRSVILWRRAVHAFAAADLADTHTDIDATEGGRDRNEARAAASDDLRRTATAALRDIMGRTRTRVALK